MADIEKLRSLYAAYGEGDVAKVLDAMDARMEWREAEGNPYRPEEGVLVGPDAIVQGLFTKLRAEWDEFMLHPASFLDAGGTAVVEGRYSGVYKKTGKQLDAQFCHLWTMRGGTLTSFQQFTDTGQWQDAMGARDPCVHRPRRDDGH
jgi:ketosteroid isomerase-like protein